MRLVPAGHVLGSAQIVLDYRGSRVVVSGDYKRRPDPTCAAVRAGQLRSLHHRGDVWPAGFPPSRRTTKRSTSCCIRSACFPSAAISSGSTRSANASASWRLLRRAGYEEPVYLHGASDRDDRALRAASECRWARSCRCRHAAGRAEGPDRARPARRPAEPGRGAARSACRPGLGLDAGAPARQGERGGAAAGHLRSRRLGRADRRPWTRLPPTRSGSRMGARRRSSITRQRKDIAPARWPWPASRRTSEPICGVARSLLFTPSRNGKLRLMQEYFASQPRSRSAAGHWRR